MSTPHANTFSGTDMPDLAELPWPSAVSLFPQTLAWKLLLVAVVMVLLVTLALAYRRYQRRRWRRQAQVLAAQAQQSAQADEWFLLIKRVSLLHLGLPQLQTLDDAQLLAQLPALTPQQIADITHHHYRQDARLPGDENQQLAAAFDRWLKELPDV